jgi:hypothetical protein
MYSVDDVRVQMFKKDKDDPLFNTDDIQVLLTIDPVLFHFEDTELSEIIDIELSEKQLDTFDAMKSFISTVTNHLDFLMHSMNDAMIARKMNLLIGFTSFKFSEVPVRGERAPPLTHFSSKYPANNALFDVIAYVFMESVEVEIRDISDEIEAFYNCIIVMQLDTTADLFNPYKIKQTKKLAKVEVPAGCILIVNKSCLFKITSVIRNPKAQWGTKLYALVSHCIDKPNEGSEEFVPLVYEMFYKKCSMLQEGRYRWTSVWTSDQIFQLKLFMGMICLKQDGSEYDFFHHKKEILETAAVTTTASSSVTGTSSVAPIITTTAAVTIASTVTTTSTTAATTTAPAVTTTSTSVTTKALPIITTAAITTATTTSSAATTTSTKTVTTRANAATTKSSVANTAVVTTRAFTTRAAITPDRRLKFKFPEPAQEQQQQQRQTRQQSAAPTATTTNTAPVLMTDEVLVTSSKSSTASDTTTLVKSIFGDSTDDEIQPIQETAQWNSDDEIPKRAKVRGRGRENSKTK